jgi:replicative DNA helicase
MAGVQQLTPAPKNPPHSIEAEQSVIGALLISSRAWDDVQDLRADDFYANDHRVIWRALAEMLSARKPVDYLTLTDHLSLQNRLDEAGGRSYVAGLAMDTPSAANVRAYAQIVRERSLLRSLIAAGQDIAELGYWPDGKDPQALMAKLQEILATVDARESRPVDTFGQATVAALESIERTKAERAAGRAPGIPFGILALDRATGGMRPGDLIGVAARTSVGKTAFAVQAATHAARSGCRGLMLTLEENPAAVALRHIANVGRINLSAMRNGNAQAVDQANDAVVTNDLTSLPLWIDSRTFDLAGIRARIARFVRTERIAFAVVDHIGLVSVGGGNLKRYEQLGAITRTLKQTAEELQIAIVCLVQIGRDAAKLGRRPALFDLRESGNIEQDLSCCIALHDPQPEREQSETELRLELGLLKNRYGHRFWLPEKLRFYGGFQRFEQEAVGHDASPADYADMPPPQRPYCEPIEYTGIEPH